MNSFAAWGLTILGLAVITTVAEMLLPSGKTRNVIRSVAATIAVLAIVTPLPNLLKYGFSFDFTADSVVVDTDYIDYTDGLKANIVSNSAVEYLRSKGFEGGIEVTVELDGWSVKSATINFSDIGMTENGEHINKKEIIKLVADYLRIGEEAIMSYG